MGKKRTQQPSASTDDLLKTLGDFTSKENWDSFFTVRGSDDSFEWYAEWPQLRDSLFPLLQQQQQQPSPSSSSLQILVPGCGNSRLSEHLYDAGFEDVTNVDFSKVVISDMLRRNVRDRPNMRWRVMDMTQMQFTDDTFDVVLDKGGLDALMEPELGPKLGNQYLSEVKRVLKSRGKFICLTLAESHVLGLLFPKFRFGWKLSLYAIPQKPSSNPELQTFMLVAEKENSNELHQIMSSFSRSSLDCHQHQASGLCEALENENRIRGEYLSGSDILYSLEDLQLGAKGDLTKLSPGRRVQLTLGEQGGSRFCYNAVLLDAKQPCGPFSFHCGVFIVPKTRAHEWLFSSEEGQWQVVESSKAARLIMKDLSPLVKPLAPADNDKEDQIPFMTASDGIKQRNIVYQGSSSLTGPIVIEDVVYENADGDVARSLPFRRLIFRRTEGLVQSEALLTRDGSFDKSVSKSEPKKASSSSKSKRRGTQRKNNESSSKMKVYHGFLASSYHTGIISGLSLISSYLESVASAGNRVKAVVIGLGAGLLPMFLHECMQFMQIEVVELDPTMLNLARDYFGFTQDKHLKVHIADGIEFVRDYRNLSAAGEMPVHENKDALSSEMLLSSNGRCNSSDEETGRSTTIDILIVDVDSSDSSSGMTCPAADFVEESFLRTVKDTLSEQGLFVINLVSRSSAIKDTVVSRMKEVFSHLFCLQLEGEVNLVIFGLCSESYIKEDCIPEATLRLEKLLKPNHPEISQSINDAVKKLRCLK
ncbi:S-adenosyl-L-methionine-dependent methyltransferases superfamily protein, putative [Theobroma cacao]|uniref:S-adenosyl-L-methionine-dependent methyltransferases superfamily protein, putative n=1 Tax=Theobroma cacao TaxID=3641 RepID=A0A061EKP6_THECC|nr:S-adenosyl-L-methionine-dependent methyltransferases superfamily protein, putative [Theobroma cacao]